MWPDFADFEARPELFALRQPGAALPRLAGLDPVLHAGVEASLRQRRGGGERVSGAGWARTPNMDFSGDSRMVCGGGWLFFSGFLVRFPFYEPVNLGCGVGCLGAGGDRGQRRAVVYTSPEPSSLGKLGNKKEMLATTMGDRGIYVHPPLCCSTSGANEVGGFLLVSGGGTLRRQTWGGGGGGYVFCSDGS